MSNFSEVAHHILIYSFIHSLVGSETNQWDSYAFLREFFLKINCILSDGYVSPPPKKSNMCLKNVGSILPRLLPCIALEASQVLSNAETILNVFKIQEDFVEFFLLSFSLHSPCAVRAPRLQHFVHKRRETVL